MSITCAISVGVIACCEEGASVTNGLPLYWASRPSSSLSPGLTQSPLPPG